MTNKPEIEERKRWITALAQSKNPKDLGLLIAKIEVELQTHTDKLVAEERQHALAIIKKYEAMPFSPTTFSRIKAALTPTTSSDKTNDDD